MLLVDVSFDDDEPILPPEVRIQPLKAIKAAASTVIGTLDGSGLDDRIGALTYSETVNWATPLSNEFAAVPLQLLEVIASENPQPDRCWQAPAFSSDTECLSVTPPVVRPPSPPNDHQASSEPPLRGTLSCTADVPTFRRSTCSPSPFSGTFLDPKIRESPVRETVATSHVVGVGNEVNQDLLNNVAGITGGDAYFVSVDQAPDDYEDELTSQLNLLGLSRVHSRLVVD